MNLTALDWVIVGVLMAGLLALAAYVKRFMRSVSDFLAANRMAGRYIVSVSNGFGGAISMVALWEMTYANGLPAQWGMLLMTMMGLCIAISGFVVYRLRETRALTLAQFFEMRYSRRFRIFAGSLSCVSGFLNYGIFPAVTAKFVMMFIGFPEAFQIFGVQVPVFPVLMAVNLSIAAYIACSGGEISIMLTDFFQGMVMLMVFLAVMFFFFHRFGWDDIMVGLRTAPEGASMINPFKAGKAADFNAVYFLIGVMGAFYTTRAWQAKSAAGAAAKTPHETVMAGIVSNWRELVSQLCMVIIPLAAYAAIKGPGFPEIASAVKERLAVIADPVIRTQMTVPTFVACVLPAGLMGLFAATVMMMAISTDSMYMHAWGTIFVQDVVLPSRGRPADQKRHLLMLRLGVLSVAVFAFFFSLLFPMKEFVLMYFALTGAIYMGGAGSVIVGGLYWKRGTAAGAWVAMAVGSVMGIGGILVQQFWKDFPLNGQHIYFWTMCASIASYVGVSLLGPRHVHDMDKLLHRGKYADAGGPQPVRRRFSLRSLTGVEADSPFFDKFIAYGTLVWSFGWVAVFVAVSVIGAATGGLTDFFWEKFWYVKLILITGILGTICTVWIAAGGFRDAIYLVRDLRAEKIDETDDGFVRDEKNNDNRG
ncbi:MAG: sodium:solute symporter [Kiritimatiellae bacterium]|nr:sodium:solute symporter [Kiritimatiellia bacterium]